MKKQITLLGFSVLMVSAVPFSAISQQQKNNNSQREQHQDQPKKKNKPAKAGNAEHGQAASKMKQKDNPGKAGMSGNNWNKDKNNNNGKNNPNGNKYKNNDVAHVNNGKNDMKDGYRWDQETFKNRNKIRNHEKVTLCHKFKSATEPNVAISVSSHALKAHLAHGDIMGTCPPVAKDNFSDIFRRRRSDYYNTIENSQEQVSYSRSILDYALIRLTNSRVQLASLQNNNMPAAEIKRKQAAVAGLEQNVSLLQTLIGVAVNVLVYKLQ